MSGGLVIAILALGLAVIVVRRRSVAIALVAAQSLALSVGAFTLASGRSGDFLVASVVLATKASRTSGPRAAGTSRGSRVRRMSTSRRAGRTSAGAGAIALVTAAVLPRLGLASARTERAAVALVLIGIAIVAARRPALHQLTGLIVAENGLALLAVAVPGGLSYVVELGALLDLVLVVTVAAAFIQRIHTELGTGDTELLRGLRG